MGIRILHLTLHKKWFDAIASGKKKIEYRELNQYWVSRLHNREFDEVHFRNGYRKDAPFMRVQCRDIEPFHIFEGKSCYGIILGDIVEIRNWRQY